MKTMAYTLALIGKNINTKIFETNEYTCSNIGNCSFYSQDVCLGLPIQLESAATSELILGFNMGPVLDAKSV